MKKILIVCLFLLFLLVGGINLKAQTTNTLEKLYIIMGDSHSLELEGYKLINTPDIDTIGIKEAEYIDSNHNTYIREIEVISEKMLENGFINSELYEKKKFNYDDIVLVASDNSFIVLNNNSYYLVYLDGDDYVEKLIVSQPIGQVTNVYYDEGSNIIYGCGNVFNDESMDIFVFYYLPLTNLFKKRIIGSSGTEETKGMIVNDNYIYIGCTTTSSSGIFEHEQRGIDSYLLKINSGSLQVVDSLDLSSEGNDNLVGMSIIDDKVYILHAYLNNYLLTEALQIDEEFNINNRSNITLFDNYNLLAFKENYLVISDYDYQRKQNYITIYKLNEYLKLEILDIKELNTNQFIDFMVLNSLVLLYDDDGINVDIYTPNNKIINKTLDIDNVIGLYENKIISLNNHVLSYYSLDYFILESLSSDNFTDDIRPIGYTFFNNLPSNKSYTNANPDVFGYYDYYVIFDGFNFDLSFRKIIKVDLDLSVSDDIYLVGMSISFNGKGYLNDELISSGYVVNEVGSYVLRLEGNRETRIISFTIEDYTLNKNKIENEEINIQWLDEKSQSFEYLLSNKEMNNEVINKDYISNLWLLMIPISVTVMGVTIFLIAGKRYL